MSHSHSGALNIRPDPYLAEVYWMFAGGVIALAVLANVKEQVEYRLRYVSVHGPRAAETDAGV